MPSAPKGAPPPPQLQHVQISWHEAGVVELALARAPVNAVNLELWEEIEAALKYLERLFPKHARALVLTSALTRSVFCAGVEVSELHAPSTTRRRCMALLVAGTRALTRLYTSPLATVCAVRGVCYTAGCMLALCCDARLAAPDALIGLNEAANSITVPRYWARLFLAVADKRARAEEALLHGTMLKAREAHEIGLFDRVVQAEDLRGDAFRFATKLTQLPSALGYAKTKRNVRQQFVNEWLAYASKEANDAWTDLSSKDSVAAIGGVLGRLGRAKM